jgi:uncharacterized protein
VEFPFCSERCRLLDLGNWASEKYVVSEPAIDESDPEIPEWNPRGKEEKDKDEEDGHER